MTKQDAKKIALSVAGVVLGAYALKYFSQGGMK